MKIGPNSLTGFENGSERAPLERYSFVARICNQLVDKCIVE